MDDGGRPTTDGGGRHVAIAEWDVVLDHMERFCENGDCSVDSGRVTCEFPSARLTVGEDGTVEAGMPLHAFERTGVETLRFDHDRGEFIVETADDEAHLLYTFRRP